MSASATATLRSRPRQLVFRGTVDAAAFLIDAHVTGDAAARERVLALWPHATAILRAGGAFFVRLARPMTVVADRAPGLPLAQRGGAYVAFDIDERTLRELGPLPEPTIVRIDAGELAVTTLTSADAIDPAEWIDLDDFAIATPDSLAPPPPKPRLVHETTTADVRALLPVGPVAEPGKLAGLLEALAKSRGQTKPKEAAPARPAPSPLSTPRSGDKSRVPWGLIAISVLLANLLRSSDPGAALGALFGLLLLALLIAGIVYALRGVRSALVTPGGGAAAGTSAAGASAPASAAAPVARRSSRKAKPKSAGEILDRAAPEPGESALRRFLTRFFAVTRLSSLIGRAHAKHLMKMLQLFDEGNFDDALRHAIPLGGDGVSAGIAFAPPDLRSRLSITLGSGGGPTYTVPLSDDVYRELQRRYRAAFERLDQLGRVEDAAFVLAELLRANEEAVSYLERKGKLRLAAEVAEARKLPPEIVVRQWLLAGERDRAFAIARAHNAYGAAVKRLESTHPETAKLLRAHWAEWLAKSGQYVAAVEVVWPIEELRPTAAHWIDRAIEQGGPAGARMLVWRMTLQAETTAESAAALLDLFDDDDPDTGSRRVAAGKALLDASATPDVQLLSRVAARSLLRDELRDGDAELLRRLVRHSGDGALQADLPPLPSPRNWSANAPFSRIVIDAVDRGTLPIHDAAALPDGRVAVALGEAGVDVLARDGRRIVHFDQPAYSLVVSDQRDRAIVLAPRGRVQRLARIDFAARRAEFWCDAELHAFARDYDGALWFAAHGNELLAIDATAARLDAVWHNPDFPVTIHSLARTRTSLGVFGGGEGSEVWQIDLPSLVLRSRILRPPEPMSLRWPPIVSTEGSLLETRPPDPPGHEIWDAVVSKGYTQQLVIDRFDGEAVEYLLPRALDQWVVLEARADPGLRILLADTTGLRASIALRGASSTTVRREPGKLLIGDDLGRLLVFDLVRGVVTANVRV